MNSPRPTKTLRALTTATPLLAALATALPVQAQSVGWHPATAQQPAVVAGIDANTFLVQPPVTVTWLTQPTGADDLPRYAQAPRAPGQAAE